MRRTLLSAAAVIMAAFIMAIGGVDNVVRSQTPPPAPNAVSVVNGANLGSVVVSWEAVAGAASYRIGWMANEDYEAAGGAQGPYWSEEFRYSDIGNRRQTSHMITRLTPGIDYWFIVGSKDTGYGPPEWSMWAGLGLTPPATVVQPGQGGTPLSSSTFSSSASKYQAVDAGKNHTCGIKLDNTLECWGDNTQGQTNAPEGQFLSVSAGGVYSCGINFENQLACWGHAAIPSPPDGNYTHVSVGDEHACAITVAVDNQNRLFAGACPITTVEPPIRQSGGTNRGCQSARAPITTVRSQLERRGRRIAGVATRTITPFSRVTSAGICICRPSARAACTSVGRTMTVRWCVAVTMHMDKSPGSPRPRTKARPQISTPTAR